MKRTGSMLLIDAVTTGRPEMIDLSIVGLITSGRETCVSYQTGRRLVIVYFFLHRGDGPIYELI